MTENEAKDAAYMLAGDLFGMHDRLELDNCYNKEIDILTTALLSAATVPDGCVRTPMGEDVKEIGVPPRTADGVRVMPDSLVALWCPKNLSRPEDGYEPELGRVRLYSDGTYCHSSDNRNQCWDVSRCYSSSDAALAALKEGAKDE